MSQRASTSHCNQFEDIWPGVCSSPWLPCPSKHVSGPTEQQVQQEAKTDDFAAGCQHMAKGLAQLIMWTWNTFCWIPHRLMNCACRIKDPKKKKPIYVCLSRPPARCFKLTSCSCPASRSTSVIRPQRPATETSAVSAISWCSASTRKPPTPVPYRCLIRCVSVNELLAF